MTPNPDVRLSVITPAFNEAGNLDLLHRRLAAALSANRVEWEWLIVDDHSSDSTFDIVRELASRDSRVRGLRLTRNYGSHTAIACGLHHASGDAAFVLAGDLQDPPETVAALLREWRGGAQVVWAVRRQVASRGLDFSRLYYFIMRHIVGMKEMPASGADVFLADRVVVEAFRTFTERHVSVLALVTWMGYQQAFVEYEKQPRHSGQSGWTLRKKIKLVIDSITGFSEFPIRVCSWFGMALLGAAALVALRGNAMMPDLGEGILIVLAVVLGLSGVQLLALGIVGEYVWRGLEETRRRPPYLIEQMVGVAVPQMQLHE